VAHRGVHFLFAILTTSHDPTTADGQYAGRQIDITMSAVDRLTSWHDSTTLRSDMRFWLRRERTVQLVPMRSI
jgi:hypothetical protein